MVRIKLLSLLAMSVLVYFSSFSSLAEDGDMPDLGGMPSEDGGGGAGGGGAGGGGAGGAPAKPKTRYEIKKEELLKKRNAREQQNRAKRMAIQKAARDKANDALPEEKKVQYIDNVPDGFYLGSGQGMVDVIEVAVQIVDGRILAVRVQYHDEGKMGIGAIDKLIPEMVKANTGSVHAVSGATATSTALSAAVTAAIASAAAVGPLDSWPPAINRGQRRTERKRAAEELKEKAERLSAGKARRAERENKRRQEYERQMANRGKRLQLLKDGATRINEEEEEEEEGFVERTYFDDLDDGWYVGSGIGYKSKQITLAVRIKDGEIVDFSILREEEEKPKGAFQKIFKQVIKNNSTDSIETVSGATMTSSGIVAAVQEALKAECQKKRPRKITKEK